VNSKLVVLIAVLAIGVGLYGLLQKGPEANSSLPTQQAPVPEEQFAVYVIKQSIRKGGEIKRSNLRIEQWPRQKANQQGIDSDQTLPQGHILLARNTMHAGDVLSADNIVTPASDDYLEYATSTGHVPFPIEVRSDSVVGGVIQPMGRVDILALSSASADPISRDDAPSVVKDISLSPLLMSVKVLKIGALSQGKNRNRTGFTTLILELTNKQVAKLTIAQRIAQLEVHKSLGKAAAKELSADAGDVLENYRAIHEYRADKATIR
jgi:pilus assembly protein CpaB